MGYIILIDNGHGKETPGKRSPDGRLRECYWTRDIAARIVEGLKKKGIAAFLLTPEDIDVPLVTRVRRVEAYCHQHGKERVILVSVHCNAAGDGYRWLLPNGWSAYTTHGETDSDKVAKSLYAMAEECFPGRKIRFYNTRKDPDYEAQLYILRKTSCAAVLTENFFMDNIDDVDYLLSAEGKDAVVKCHVEGLEKYIQSIKG